MPEEKRVVLVKPGDVLLISGVTLELDEAGIDANETVARFFREHCGVSVALFEDDITIGVAPAEDVERLVRDA